MSKYSITAPDGHSYNIEGPDGASDEDVIAAVKARYPDAEKPFANADNVKNTATQSEYQQANSIPGAPVAEYDDNTKRPVKFWNALHSAPAVQARKDSSGFQIDENGEPIATAAEGFAGGVHKLAHDLDPVNIVSKFGRDVSKSAERQGGWGLSPETRAGLGADDTQTTLLGQLGSSLKNAGVNTLDGLYRAGQAGLGALDALPRTVLSDQIVDDPVIQAMFAGEAAPGSVLNGRAKLTTPKGDVLDPVIRERLNAESAELFNQGATFEDMQTWAKKSGLSPFKDDLKAELAKRDAGKTPPVSEVPEPTPVAEPNPVEEPAQSSGAATTELTPEADLATTAAGDKPVNANDNSEALPNSPSDTAPTTPTSEAAPPVEHPDDTVTRFIDALQSAGKARAGQDVLYSAERKKRVAMAGKAFESGDTEGGMKALGGELPKASFEEIASQFTPEEIKGLQDKINSSNLDVYSTATAHKGFRKLMTGVIPAPSELAQLGKVYPSEFIKAALSNRSQLAKSADFLEDVWHLPKSAMSSVDLSAPLRQGAGLAHRQEYWDSFVPMMKSLVSQKHFNELEAAMEAHPEYGAAQKAGLAVGDVAKGSVVKESFQSQIANKLLPHVKISERAYTAFLDKLRFDTFVSMKKEAEGLGHDVSLGSDTDKAIANYINVVTGRGNLGKYEGASRFFNDTMFSARFVSSRLDLLTAPVRGTYGKGFIAELPAGLRKEAAKSYGSIASLYALTTGLAAAGGATVSGNPFSSDFGKAVDGNTRLDSMNGFQQYVVVGARALGRQSTSLKTGQTKSLDSFGNSPLDNDIRFVLNKAHPSLSLILDQQKGKDGAGEPFEWQKALLQRITPMAPADIIATLKEHPNNVGMYYAVLGVLGEGLQNFDPKHPKGLDAKPDRN